MLTPTKVTINIREATTTLISDRGIHRTGEPFIIEFEGESITDAVTKSVLWLEKVECPAEQFEWALIRWAMCNWIRRKADPRDPFKRDFSYASGRLWMITLKIEEIPCNPQPVLLPPTNTKSLLRSILNGWKWLCRNT